MMPIIRLCLPNLYDWAAYIKQVSGFQFDSVGANWYFFRRFSDSYRQGRLSPFDEIAHEHDARQ